jgi:Rieske Fe-S protein
MTDSNTADLASSPARRCLLKSAAVLGVAVPFLAACGGSDEPSSSGATSAGAGSQSPCAPPAGAGAAGDVVTTAADVPEGGGVIVDDAGIVVTQPTAGQFKGFSTTCTHMGSAVSTVSDGTINCACHGSKFSITDGSVVQGPAAAPLEARQITVNGGEISLA